ncbi:division plane positioning ATPase MipZ [Bosea eneae]|uniref:Division plane positioning ATPase MipZ n=1 Tax=Bosea eneae TaxID=151454 RepID=A0ABW0ILH2_9HYPH
MARLKHSLISGTTLSQLVIVANEKGGQGKSLIALAVADHAYLHGARLGIAQVDAQYRLAHALGRNVLTIAPVAKDARRDPAAEARSFTPLYGLIEKAAGRGASVLIDTGANQATRLAHWSGLVDLAEDLTLWKVAITLIVPYVAEAEGMRQAAQTATLLRDRIPQGRLVLVENERDGSFAQLHPASDAASVHRTMIAPLKAQATTLRMPSIEAGSWRPFEAARCRFVQVAQMPVEKVMTVTGLPRPEAKIVRGDVAGWTATVFDELDHVLPWSKRGGAHG